MAEMSEGKKDFTDVQDPTAFFREIKKSRDVSWEQMMNHLRDDRGMQIVDLWERGKAPNYNEEYGQKAPRLALYPAQEGAKRGALIVCAGGAFMFKSWNEAEPVADYFYSKGFYTAILDYRVQPYTTADSTADGHRAIRYLRAHADELNIDPAHVAIGGFSAGGMLSNRAATMYTEGDPNAEDQLERISSRPDAAILGYGAFMSAVNIGGLGFSFEKQRELAKDAPEMLLTPDCPPYFMFQTVMDDPRNIAQMQLRLAEKGIPFEAHTFSEGMHGNGLYDGKNEVQDVPHTAHWAELCAEWLEGQGFPAK